LTHETHTARKILSMALSRARELGLPPPRIIPVRIGAWTGVDSDHLKHDFEDLAPGVELVIELVDPSGRCEDCGAEFGPGGPVLTCANCGGKRVRLDQSKEIELVDTA
jgi:Zn finger protein HypA/HybF involved in hydrogenase expression